MSVVLLIAAEQILKADAEHGARGKDRIDCVVLGLVERSGTLAGRVVYLDHTCHRR